MAEWGALVARHRELAFFDATLDELPTATGVLVEVAGEPGIGKSRLLAELGARADARGYVVLSGRAAQLEHEAPFAVFVDALDAYLASLLGDLPDRLGAHMLTELATVFPSLADAGGGQAPALQAERYRTHRAVGGLLEELGRAHPTVVLLDDVHWADPAARELLGHLLAYPPRTPVLLAMAFRPNQTPSELSVALAAACRDGRAELMQLEPLTAVEADELMGPELAEPARAVLFRESGGNPFYLEQLVRSVGSSWSGPGLSVGAEDAVVPAPVRVALAAELASLPPDARRFLEGAAVAGDPFEPDLAAAVAGLHEASALVLLDAVVDADLVRPTAVPRRFRFRHPIVRQAVYESSGAGWRVGAHARAATALAAAGTPPSALAHHVERSAKPGAEEAVAVLLEAAEATASRAPATSAHWYGAALRLLAPDDPRRIELLVARGTALGAAGRFDEGHVVVTQALEALPPDAGPVRVGLTAFAASIEMLTGRRRQAEERLLGALRALEDEHSGEAAALQLELAVLAAFTSDWEQMRVLTQRALGTIADRREEALAALGSGLRAYAVAALGDPQAPELVTSASRLFDGLDDQTLARRLDSAVYVAWAECLLERFGAAEQHLGRAVAVARATGQGQFLAPLFLGQLVPLQWQGRVEETRRLTQAAVEAARLGAPRNLLAWALFGHSWAHVNSGDLETGIALGEEAMALMQDVEPTIVSVAARMFLALGLLEAGQARRAREHLVDAIGGPAIPRYGGTFLLELLTRAELALGDVEAAEGWAARAAVVPAGGPTALETALAHRARAAVLLARGEAGAAADAALSAAVHADRAGSRVEAARARVLRGQALAKAGQRSPAVTELKVAQHELSACGAHGFADQASALLRRLGRPQPTTTVAIGDPSSLTEREWEVARLVAAGQTNRQIATACYLSPKTVERHLSSIFTKLGVANRAGVARIMAKEGAAAE